MPKAVTSARTYVSLPAAHTKTQSQLDAIYTAIKAAKVTGVRIYAPWSVAQPTNATTYTWVGIDRAVNRALLKGLQVIIVLAPPKPSWAPVNFDPALFGGFAGTIAKRYKIGGRGITGAANKGKGVVQFQVWDAPNTAASGMPLIPGTYAALLKAAYPNIKRGNPQATVIMGALQSGKSKLFGSNRMLEATGYLNLLYLSGARPYFDHAAYNPLSVATAQSPVPPPPSANIAKPSDTMRKTMVSVGDDRKGIHWSAIGYDTNDFSETQQAAYLQTWRSFAEARKDHIFALGIYTYQDDTEGS
jgi:hypothetical protein